MKTRQIGSALATSVALCMLSQPLSAETYGKFTYKTIGKSVNIVDYPDDAVGLVDIPSTIAGMPVTGIGEGAFDSCSRLVGIKIPASVTGLGNSAFEGCSALTSISLPSNLTEIGESAFRECSRLTKMTIPSNVQLIRRSTFSWCTGLLSVTIPSGVSIIEDEAFYQCSNLLSVSIPSTVTAIGNRSFQLCEKLVSLTIPSSMTSIGDWAFADCSTLANVTIPSSVVSLGEYAFYKCTGLRSLNVPSGLELISDATFEYCSGLQSVKIPTSVKVIGEEAFYGCSSLQTVTIPPSVLSIAPEAFNSCSALAIATFQGDAPAMGNSVFDGAMVTFRIGYYASKKGFTTPKWLGYPAAPIQLGAEIAIQQPAGMNLVDGRSKRSFGTATIKTSGLTRTFTIKNLGTRDLRFLAITKSGNHSKDFIVISKFTKRNILRPGASTTFKVTFKPNGTGTRNAAIHVKSNDKNENPFDIKLTGTGVAPPDK